MYLCREPRGEPFAVGWVGLELGNRDRGAGAAHPYPELLTARAAVACRQGALSGFPVDTTDSAQLTTQHMHTHARRFSSQCMS